MFVVNYHEEGSHFINLYIIEVCFGLFFHGVVTKNFAVWNDAYQKTVQPITLII